MTSQTSELVEALRLDAEMLADGWQRNLTELWHSDVVKDAAKDLLEAATLLERLSSSEVTEEDVERVARAMMSVSRPNANPDDLTPAPRGQIGSVPKWKLYEHMARAAATAMRSAATSERKG